MKWLVQTFGSSIGKKLIMAGTGLCFCGFLAAHLLGNLTLFGGPESFNHYAARLHTLGPIITVMELVLLVFAVIHVFTGSFLFFENVYARPVRYHVHKREGGRTIGSATMPYTGFLLLVFIIFHLINFHFADKSQQTLFHIVSLTFSNPAYVVLYILAMIVAAIHVSHGFWSAFQTLGANHPKYMPLIQGAGIGFSLIVGIGFGLIPVYLSLMS